MNGNACINTTSNELKVNIKNKLCKGEADITAYKLPLSIVFSTKTI